MLLSIDEQWQGLFHSEIVKYKQKFILLNFRIKVVFVQVKKLVLHNLTLSLVLYVANLCVYFTFYNFFKVVHI